MFLFWLLYILVVRAWSWLCRKVNAAPGAVQYGEKWFSKQTPTTKARQQPLIVKPKQQVLFIFLLKMYGHASFASMHV